MNEVTPKSVQCHIFSLYIFQAVRRAVNVLMFLSQSVSKYPPNVIFLLMPCSQKILDICYSIAASESEFYIGGFVLMNFIERTGSTNFSNTKPPTV